MVLRKNLQYNDFFLNVFSKATFLAFNQFIPFALSRRYVYSNLYLPRVKQLSGRVKLRRRL